MKNIETLDFSDFYILVSRINGNVLTISDQEFNDKSYLFKRVEEFHMYDEIEPMGEYNHNIFKTVYISLHTSAKCNLLCSYCFKKERDNKNLTFEESQKFINIM